MLIRLAQKSDIEQWKTFAADVAQLFDSPNMPNELSFLEYMNSKIDKHEAICAVDRMTNSIHGVIAFCKKNNRITWFAVKSSSRKKVIGAKLLQCAVNQLNWEKDISVMTFKKDSADGLPARTLYSKMGFVEVDGDWNTRCLMVRNANYDIKGGKSFHYDYARYHKYSQKEFCKPCNAEPMPQGQEDIAELIHTFICSERKAQGKLFGKCYVIPKAHYVNFEDMTKEDMVGFMQEVQLAGKALKEVTGAVKINYEMHSNSGPHLHIHLFPRYLDDDFPSAPIDYRITEPSPYESDEEYNWFINSMRDKISYYLQE